MCQALLDCWASMGNAGRAVSKHGLSETAVGAFSGLDEDWGAHLRADVRARVLTRRGRKSPEARLNEPWSRV